MIDGPPSWSLDVSETGESTKCLWVGVMGLKAWGEGAEKSTLPSFARIKRPGWRPVGLNDWHLPSNGKIGDCEQSTARGCEATSATTPFSVHICGWPTSFPGSSLYREVGRGRWEQGCLTCCSRTYTKHRPGSMDHPMDPVQGPPWTTPNFQKEIAPV